MVIRTPANTQVQPTNAGSDPLLVGSRLSGCSEAETGTEPALANQTIQNLEFMIVSFQNL